MLFWFRDSCVSLKLFKTRWRVAPPTLFWVDLQPSLYCLNSRLAQQLSHSFTVRRWSFCHDPDEACSIDTLHNFLRETLLAEDQPSHLIGHGISGTVACLFAHRYPELVQSLTLLAVDTKIANHWSSHYFQMRRQLPCSRSNVLAHLSSLLISSQHLRAKELFPRLLEKCLDQDFVDGSLLKHQRMTGSLQVPSMPLLVLNAANDIVVDSGSHARWARLLKPGDRYVEIVQGRHFFPVDKFMSAADSIAKFITFVPEQSRNLDMHSNNYSSLTGGRS